MKPLSSHPFLRHWFAGRRVVVIGLGKSGAAAATLLHGLGARVSVTEKRARADVAGWLRSLPPRTAVETGGHRFLEKNWDLAVVSPGVPSSLWSPLIARGVPVWGEMELGYRVLSLAGRWPLKCAAITGTNGKTTTTALVGEVFRAAGWPTVVAGNIGTPLCAVADKITAETALALEVSSYQLEAAEAFRPAAGAVLNVTPDHLARHGTLEAYARTKFRLFQNQGPSDAAVLNAADGMDRRLAPLARGRVVWFGLSARPAPDVVLRGGRLSSTIPAAGGSWPPPAHLPGDHNVENALAAAALARLAGAPAAAVARAFKAFKGVEHRIEFVREKGGVRYYNDSKATNVDSTFVALKAFPSGGLHLILGGEDKGAPYKPLIPLVRKNARTVYLIGEAAPKIRRELAGAVPLEDAGTLERAVAAASRSARPGETVLLSPACASFDQFDNFEHRGRVFKALAAAL
jgi:UDP-N-acetylmuramoylalanine--D-glutamate ligase